MGTADPGTLQRRDHVPHFEVRTSSGERFAYSTIWQRKNLVLVSLDDEQAGREYASSLAANQAEFDARNSVWIVTPERVAGVPRPGLLVADRWGEVVHVAAATDVAASTSAADLVEWVDYIQRRC